MGAKKINASSCQSASTVSLSLVSFKTFDSFALHLVKSGLFSLSCTDEVAASELKQKEAEAKKERL